MLSKIVPGRQPKRSGKWLPQKKFICDNVGFVELLDVFGSDLTVVNAARVSFNKESEFEPIRDGYGDSAKVVGHRVSARDQNLIEYLAENKHVTPFFHPQLQFRIKMPIFVVREWYRHTIGFARNEVSRRYVTYEPEFFVPVELRKRDPNVKQGSSSEVHERNDDLLSNIRKSNHKALELYNYLLEQGVCPEQARIVLPQSMYTEFIETASLAGYARLVDLRLDSSAQKEIRDYAQIISSMVEKIFPVSWRALVKYNEFCERKIR
jgi:thymidylate synthase (FAD)